MKFNLALIFILCSPCALLANSVDQSKPLNLHDKTVSHYDKFRDKTLITSADYEVTNGLWLNFGYACKGDTSACNASVVIIQFTTLSHVFPNGGGDVIFLLDGNLREQCKLNGQDTEWEAADAHDEKNLYATMEPSGFLSLIHAHVVEGEVGQTEFMLKEKSLENLRAFATGIHNAQ